MELAPLSLAARQKLEALVSLSDAMPNDRVFIRQIVRKAAMEPGASSRH